jgi:starvation-inducible DNA-binding protein
MAPKTPAPSRANGHTRRRSPQPKLDLAGPEIQPFDTLRALPIGLPDKAKASSCRLLNEILADSMVLYAL